MAGPRSAQRASTGATVALAALLAVAAFMVVMPLVMSAIAGEGAPAPLPPQHQRGETLSYLLAFALLTPLALIAARRLAPALAAAVGDAGLSASSRCSAAGLLGAIIAVKALERAGGSGGVSAVLARRARLVAACGGARGPALRPWPAPTARGACDARLDGRDARRAAAVLCFAVLGSIDPVVAGARPARRRRRDGRSRAAARRRPPRPWGCDRATSSSCLALLALVPDLLIFRPEAAAAATWPPRSRRGSSSSTTTSCSARPTRCSTAARCSLRRPPSTASTSIYLIAAWFADRPDRLRDARPADRGADRALVRGRVRDPAAGGHRAAPERRGARRGRRRARLQPRLSGRRTPPVRPAALRAADGARPRPPSPPSAGRGPPARWRTSPAWRSVGLSAVWSLESLAYTAVVFAALVSVRALARRRAGAAAARPRPQSGCGALACVAAHLLFALATLVFAGRSRLGRVPRLPARVPLRRRRRPHLRRRAAGHPRWRSAPAMPSRRWRCRARSAAAARSGRRERPALVGARRDDGLRDRAAQLLRRPLPGPHPGPRGVARPAHRRAVARRAAPRAERRSRRRSGPPGWRPGSPSPRSSSAVAWSSVPERFPRTPLARPPPVASRCAARSTGCGIRRRSRPPLPPGERGLARRMPGERASLMLVSPTWVWRSCCASGRVDRLFLGDPWEASFVAAGRAAGAARARSTRSAQGDRMLDRPGGRSALAALRADPSLDPLDDRVPALAPLQQWALQADRSRATSCARSRRPQDGFTVLELRPPPLNLRERRIPRRCSISRTPAHSVFSP